MVILHIRNHDFSCGGIQSNIYISISELVDGKSIMWKKKTIIIKNY